VVSPPASPRRFPTAALLAGFVALSALTRWLSFVVPVLDIDESAHIVGSWEMLRGGLLYTDFVNNKPPLLYAYYAAAQLLFGRSLIGVHVFTALVTVPLTALAVSAFFDHTRRGVVAAVAFLVFGAAFLGHDVLASNAEIAMMLPAAWAFVAVRDERRLASAPHAAASGLLLGVAVLIKYQAGTWLPGIALVMAWAAWRRRGAVHAVALPAVMAAAAIAPMVTTWAWFRARGGDAMLIYWTIGNNVAYTTRAILPREAGERFLSYAVPFALVTAPLWWAAWRLRASDEPRARQVVMLTLVLCAIPAAFLGLRFYPHYFVQLYAPLAIAAAPWLEAQVAPRATRAGRLVVGWALAMLAGFMVANAVLYLGGLKVYREIDPVFRKVADRLRADACAPGATMFVWGYAPAFYYYADLPIASRFAVMAQSRLTGYVSGNLASVRGEMAPDPVVPEHWDWLMSDLERRRATFIVDTAPAGIYLWDRYPVERYPRLRDYLLEHYEVVDTVDGVRIYRRASCAREGGARTGARP
jgi:4-amino-4-deoxy-L-arabinose transferase-like glycosyltransferase